MCRYCYLTASFCGNTEFCPRLVGGVATRQLILFHRLTFLCCNSVHINEMWKSELIWPFELSCPFHQQLGFAMFVFRDLDGLDLDMEDVTLVGGGRPAEVAHRADPRKGMLNPLSMGIVQCG